MWQQWERGNGPEREGEKDDPDGGGLLIPQPVMQRGLDGLTSRVHLGAAWNSLEVGPALVGAGRSQSSLLSGVRTSVRRPGPGSRSATPLHVTSRYLSVPISEAGMKQFLNPAAWWEPPEETMQRALTESGTENAPNE